MRVPSSAEEELLVTHGPPRHYECRWAPGETIDPKASALVEEMVRLGWMVLVPCQKGTCYHAHMTKAGEEALRLKRLALNV